MAEISQQVDTQCDRVVRVFVSSTFRDMIEDRNELMSHVWPALRQLCRERAVEFVEVDLRWGITEEQAQRQETVRHCLAEIKRCRPFFIGLLGERYGWVPGPEAYSPTLLEEERWLESAVAKHSVTELEILHGVLNNPDMAGRAFFYFRDPAYAQAHGGDYLSENATCATWQQNLKQQVRAVCQAKGIPLCEDYPDPQQLAVRVLADLTAAIDAEFPPDQAPDVWAREARDHEAYARSRCTEFYVGRESYFSQLDAFARDGADGCGFMVLGESGGGKSALLANWAVRWRQTHPDDFVFQHYIGSSPQSSGHLGLMRRLMIAIVRWCGGDEKVDDFSTEEERIPAHTEEIIKVFPEYLDRLALKVKERDVRAVLVLDALNQIEDRERGRLLAWLPYRLPGELRLVVSTLPGDTLDALEPRGWSALTVEPLTEDERIRLIARYLARFSQGLSENRAGKIAQVPAAANPLYLKTLLDDLRATGAHDQLDAQIADYLQASDIPTLFEKILTRYERDYERDHLGLVREALALLWAARRGLTEPELLEVLSPDGQERLPAALWSPLRCALADGLVDHDGVLAFSHDHLRESVRRKYIVDDDMAKALRLCLADAFAKRPTDARQADELPWLLCQASARDRLRVCLLDIERFLLILQRDENELLGYWIWLGEERVMGRAYLETFEMLTRILGNHDEIIASAAVSLAVYLNHAALHTEAESLLWRALKIDEKNNGVNHNKVAIDLNNLAQLLLATNRLEEAEQQMRRVLAIWIQNFEEDNPNVAIALNNLAQLLQSTNRTDEAEALYQRALAIYNKCFGVNHPKTVSVLNNLAQLLQITNRLMEAESLMQQVLVIDEYNWGSNHPDVARDLNNLGDLMHATNRLEEAETLLRRALTIDEYCFGPHHPNVARDLNNLACLMRDTNLLTDAEKLLFRALAIDELCFGDNHPNVARDMSNIAQILLATNRVDEAEPLMRRALAIDEHSYAEDNPIVAIRLNNLANLMLVTNRLEEAEPLFRRALVIDEQSYGANHPNIAIRLNSLAQLLQATNRLADAEPLMWRVVDMFEQSYGDDHPNVATALNNLAGLLQATNRLADAEALFRRALIIWKRSLGENHPQVATANYNLASLLQDSNRLSEAEPLFKQALAIMFNFTRDTGHEPLHMSRFVNKYAGILMIMGCTREQAIGKLNDIGREYGFKFGGG